MKFRMSSYYTLLLTVSAFLFILLICFFGLLFLFVRRSFVFFLVIIAMNFWGLVDVFRLMRIRGFPWISFSSTQVSIDCCMGVHKFIPWDECKDIGVLRADFSVGPIRQWRKWLYFSRMPLTDNLVYRCRKQPNFKQDEFIMVEYRPEVLTEVLKYVPKDQIRNLHLLEQ